MSASDHPANERTFLAWFRTAISLLGFGVLIAKLRLLEAGAGLGQSAGIRSPPPRGLLTLSIWQYYRSIISKQGQAPTPGTAYRPLPRSGRWVRIRPSSHFPCPSLTKWGRGRYAVPGVGG